jgi:hypothetical protein
MRTLRTLAIVIIGAGLFAGMPLMDAQACDDDRYPCPVRSQISAQETVDAPAQPAPSAQPKKKVNHPRANEKASAKREGEVRRAAAPAKLNKPAVHEKAADTISQKAAEAAPAAAPSSRADQLLNDESRGLVATAGTAWPVIPNTEVAGASALEATGRDTAEATKVNAVQLVNSNEVNDRDLAAAATAPAESSWTTYLLLILGAALAAASAIWLFTRMTSMYARQAAGKTS